ncbi:MAG: hypothetical protein Aurels2KO_53950 [Aureliella sp.]
MNRHSETNTIIDQDFLFPLVDSQQSLYRPSTNRRSMGKPSRQVHSSWAAYFWHKLWHYCLWPLAKYAIGRLWRLVLVLLLLKFALGIDFSYLWNVASALGSINTFATEGPDGIVEILKSGWSKVVEGIR